MSFADVLFCLEPGCTLQNEGGFPWISIKLGQLLSRAILIRFEWPIVREVLKEVRSEECGTM